ncbi:MAG: SDR family NAD(P)-dependent oxidoreductase [Alphaproteobacteria bacterium]|nr:SDR family NAD(P)-dependent oxidoreductase [Alphaproteobacteria bacterium]
MTTDLSGRVALVTGAAGGIGAEFTGALLAAGATVVAADVSQPALTTLGERMAAQGLGARLVPRRLDISDQPACAAAVAEVQDRFGSLDILVNNGAVGMGVIRDDHMVKLVTIDEIEPAMWDRFVSTNLSGAWYLTHAAVPAMKAAGWGRVVTVTTSFFTMLRGKFHPYGPCKAGLEAMAAGHAAEFAADGVTVNVIVPGGPTDTPFVPEVSGFKRSDLIPPSVMAPPLIWLCSRDADGVTGNRYVAAHWDPGRGVEAARASSEAPIGWPDLATAPVWPGSDANR